MEQSVVYRTLLPVCLSILLSPPSTSSLNSPTTTTTITLTLTTLSILTPSAVSSTANFCPVEGTDYIDKPDGNMIKVTFPSQLSILTRDFSSDDYFDIVLLLYEDKKTMNKWMTH